MTSWYSRRMFSRWFVSRFALCLCSLFLGCHRTPHANEILKPTVCDLRERPDEFGGKVVQVSGWIYTDIEHFGLEEPNCGVSLEWSESQTKSPDTQVGQIHQLAQDCKKKSIRNRRTVVHYCEGEI